MSKYFYVQIILPLIFFFKREFSRVQDLFLRLNNFITSVISQKVTLLIDGNVGEKYFNIKGKDESICTNKQMLVILGFMK